MLFNRDNPFLSRLKSRIRVSGINSGKNVQRVVLDIADSGITYKCGDALGVLPKNNIDDVKSILECLNILGDAEVVLPYNEQNTNIVSALSESLDINELPRKFFEWFVGCLSNQKDIDYLRQNILGDSDDCKKRLKSFSLLEVLHKFESFKIDDVQSLVNVLKRLMPRLYSIASSPLVLSDEVHLVVSEVMYTNDRGNKRYGVASHYLSSVLEQNEEVKIFVVKSPFALPQNQEVDVIMIGPGVGIAPFRGFLQERAFLKSNGNKVGRNWLFFGDRRRADDFLLEDELTEYQRNGVLDNLQLAFSRDQEQKVYVQDRMWECRDDVWSWISSGAYIYVCGDASRMAVDVDSMLKKIAVEVGGMTDESAEEMFKTMKKERRYQRDVY